MSLATETFGTGRELVLVHGWGMNAGVWAPLRARLAGGWRVTAVELPGHGASDFDALGADPDAWVAALLAAAPPRALWLGWSLGGQLALLAAAQAPERFAGLALAATNPRFVRAADWPAAMPAATFRTFAEQLATDAPRTLDRFLALQVRGAVAAGDTLRLLRSATRARPAPCRAALDAGLAMLLHHDLRPLVRDLTVPSLWLFGARDALVPVAAADAVAGLTAGARVHTLAEAGHAPFLSHPQASLELLNRFAEALDDAA
jgi:pimeloyl-[acyl-carrier protein] methyl ester esterase